MAKSKYKKKLKSRKDIYEEILAELQLSQYTGFREIIDFFEDQTTYKIGFKLLVGSAGTGKTYLAGKVTEYLSALRNADILLCAPTNKAVRVLRETQDKSINVKFSTVHSALGLEENIDDNGVQTFRKKKFGNTKIQDFDYVILDECLMLDAELFEELYAAIKNTEIKILFVGDKFQIPPVNNLESAVFTDHIKTFHNITTVELTAVIRQHHDNTIINLANHIKNALGDDQIMSKLVRMEEFANRDQLMFIPRDNNTIMNLLVKHFVCEDFDNDADHCKVLAWTNKVVNKYNNLIRKLKYGADVSQIVIGEKLVFDKPWLNSHKKMAYSTNEEFTIRSYEKKEVDLFNYIFYYYEANISKEGSSIVESQPIDILCNESLEAFGLVKNFLKKSALGEPKGSEEAKTWWQTYYNFLGKFAAIKYNYAITVHKSQGSTYTNAIMANYDINKNSNTVERNRIKYTATTRPKELLYIII